MCWDERNNSGERLSDQLLPRQAIRGFENCAMDDGGNAGGAGGKAPILYTEKHHMLLR